jgi:glycosyltransferase involved in cell wall biosynthesis
VKKGDEARMKVIAVEQPIVSYRKNGEKIVVALPAHDEENYIAKVIIGCQRLADEVIVVDDGSRDATVDIAKSLGAIVISHDRNMGYGAAIGTCFKTARERGADIMVILDADGQHDPGDIIGLIESVNNGTDIVIGSRFISNDGNNGRNVPIYRKIGMKILDLATIHAGSEKVSDTQSGFRAYSRRAIDNIYLNGNGMSAGSEILLQAKEKCLKISEVSIVCRYDQGESSKNPISHGLDVLFGIFGRTVYKKPLLYFTSVGIILLVIGSGVGLWSISGYIASKHLPFGPSIAASLLMIIGTISISSGVVLHSVRQMFNEIKNQK